MSYKRFLFPFLVLLQKEAICQKGQIIIPTLNDEYSVYVAKIEKGNTDIDYTKFRKSLLLSAQYQVINRSKRVMDSLGFLMYQASEKSDLDKVIFFAHKLLSIDYTNLFSHKMLRQAYSYLGDSLNSMKYTVIQTGLLNSILKSGNGRICSTGWSVIQVTEEGFIIQMLGGKVTNMETNETSLCDKFTITTEEGEKEYFFKRISNKVR